MVVTISNGRIQFNKAEASSVNGRHGISDDIVQLLRDSRACFACTNRNNKNNTSEDEQVMLIWIYLGQKCHQFQK